MSSGQFFFVTRLILKSVKNWDIPNSVHSKKSCLTRDFQGEWRYINDRGSFYYSGEDVEEVRRLLEPDIEYTHYRRDADTVRYVHGPDSLQYVSTVLNSSINLLLPIEYHLKNLRSDASKK